MAARTTQDLRYSGCARCFSRQWPGQDSHDSPKPEAPASGRASVCATVEKECCAPWVGNVRSKAFVFPEAKHDKKRKETRLCLKRKALAL